MRPLSIFFTFLMNVAIAGYCHAQQNVLFSQYMFNMLYINPAYAGYKEMTNLHCAYRRQWLDFPGAPKTMSIAVDGAVNNRRVGLALQVVNDNIGVTNTTSVYANYSYRIPLDSGTKRLCFGIGAGGYLASVNADKLTTLSTNDPAIAGLRGVSMFPDARFGVFYHTDKFYVGCSADRLISSFLGEVNNDAKNYLNLNVNWYLSGGYLFDLSDELALKSTFLLKDDITGPSNIDMGLNIYVDKVVSLGMLYRTAIKIYNKPDLQKDLTQTSSIIGLIELSLGDMFKVGYSYDHTTNSVLLIKYPTHEVSLRYFFPEHKKHTTRPDAF